MAFGGWYGWGFGWHGGHRGLRRRLDEEATRLALLSLLEDKPRLGYELLIELEERASEAFDVHADDVYPVLQLLVDAEVVEVSFDDDKKLYRLTEAGRREVEDRRRKIDRVWRVLEGGPWSSHAHSYAHFDDWVSDDWGSDDRSSMEDHLDELADQLRAALREVRRDLARAFRGGSSRRRRGGRRHHRRCC